MRHTERVFDDVELLGTLVLLIIQPLKVFFLRGDLLLPLLPPGDIFWWQRILSINSALRHSETLWWADISYV